ncbi:MAG TPA: endolytic transglycosylase MltG, partial [Candidatus Deferrimicrobium sp.]|nr:endolytic transglycosylase MltG [Candidatus Deferrimicrobium sp.]
GIDFYDALTVASLVEREVKVDIDRAKVAGVYWNRLDPKLNGATGGLMQADPTVVYATDSMALDELATGKWPNYLFWDTLGVADLATVNVSPELQSHQTYQQPGLPDWPIATPTRASIEAALDPDTRKDFLFFYACPGSDTHTFAKTAAQHSRNIAQCEPS